MKTSNYLSNLRQSTYRAGILQSKAYRALMVFMNTNLKPFDMSPAEWSLVGVVFEAKQPIRPSEVAEILTIKQPVATNLIHKLLQKGIIEKTDDPTDSRAAIISLTARGSELAVAVERQLRSQMRTFLNDVNPVELSVYLAVVEKIATKL